MNLRVLVSTSFSFFTVVAALMGGCSSPSPSVPSPATAPSTVASSQPAAPRAAVRNGRPASDAIRPAVFTVPAGDDSALLFGNLLQAGTSPNNRLVTRPQFDLSYNQKNGGPNWVAWHLGASDLGSARRGQFQPDPLLPSAAQIRPGDYRRVELPNARRDRIIYANG